MPSSVEKDHSECGPVGPHWPFDLVRSAAARPPCFLKAQELAILLTKPPADPHPLPIAEACARGAALVSALRVSDHLRTEGPPDDRRDVYRSQHAGRELRVALSLYAFADQPLILLVTIEAPGGPDFG